MSDLRVFSDDVEWYAAADAADLKVVWGERNGDPDGEYFEADSWDELPPGKELTVWCNADGMPDEPHGDGCERVTKTVGEWAAQLGRGLIASTEY
jgi:hypothetical protein